MKKILVGLLACVSVNTFASVGDSSINVDNTAVDNISTAYQSFIKRLDYLGLNASSNKVDIKNLTFTTGKPTALNNKFSNINNFDAYIVKQNSKDTVYDASIILANENNLPSILLEEHHTAAFGLPIVLSDITNNTIPQQWSNIQSIDSSAVYLTKVIIEKSVETKAIDYVFIYSTSKPNKNMTSCNAYEFDFTTNTATKSSDYFDCF